MNTFVNAVKEMNNKTYTENGALTYKSTNSNLLDLFALGAAYRNRSADDCILLFKKAFEEDIVHALKCLFYLRDARGGQGERRFFRVVARWLADNHTQEMARNLKYVPEFGRWDDLYAFVGTPLEKDVFDLIKNQLALDVQCKTPSLLAKWLKSENTSSKESRALAQITRQHLGMNHKEYRKTLSILRERINVLERLMSENRWDEIEFDKIPSRAGFIYRNAFARHDLERMKSDKNVQTYEEFAKDKDSKVNAGVLYPYEIVHQIRASAGASAWGAGSHPLSVNDTQRLMMNKYWDNLTDYFNGCSLNGLCMIDTSGSMSGTPIEVALSLGAYCAERNTGPYKDLFLTFSHSPEFVEFEGVDFYDKILRAERASWSMNTNIEAAFDLILNVALKNHLSQGEIPQSLIIISDMEFDYATRWYNDKDTLMEGIRKRWAQAGYQMPNLVFWNVDARQNNIPMKVEHGISFVSGFSPVLFEQVIKGVTAFDLMYDKLDSERYACIQ